MSKLNNSVSLKLSPEYFQARLDDIEDKLDRVLIEVQVPPALKSLRRATEPGSSEAPADTTPSVTAAEGNDTHSNKKHKK